MEPTASQNLTVVHIFRNVKRTIFSESRGRQQVLQDLAILLKRTLDFLPGHELAHLLGQFPEFLKQTAQ